MAFNLETAVEFKEDGKVIPTTSFDINTAQDIENIPKARLEFRNPKEVEKGFIDSVKSRVGKFFQERLDIGGRSSVESVAEAQNIYAIAKNNNMPLLEVEKHIDSLIRDPKITGVRGDLTNEEFTGLVFTPLIAQGMIAAPLATGAGLAGFAALDHMFNLKEFLPTDSSNTTKTAVEMADFLLKGGMVAGAHKGSAKLTGVFFDRFVKGLEPMFQLQISPKQIETIAGSGVLSSKQQASLLENLGIEEKHLQASMNNNIPISVPPEKLLNVAKEPYWDKVKDILAEADKKSGEMEKDNVSRAAFLQKPTVEEIKNIETKKSTFDTLKNYRDSLIEQGKQVQSIPVSEQMKQYELTPEEQKIFDENSVTVQQELSLGKKEEPRVELEKVPRFTGNKMTDEYGKSIADSPVKVKVLEDHIATMREENARLMKEDAEDTGINKEREAKIGELSQQISLAGDALKVAKEGQKIPTEQQKILKEGQETESISDVEDILSIPTKPSRPREIDLSKVAKTPEEMRKSIEQLNKFGQMQAIMRRTGGIRNKNAVGQFVLPGRSKMSKDVGKTGEVRLREEWAKQEFNYMSTMAHELGHALEYNLLGNINKETWRVFGDNIPKEDLVRIKEELKAVTIDLEGPGAFSGPNKMYYGRPTEMLARFLQKMFESPGNLNDLAPTAMKYFNEQSVKHPIINEYLEAVRGEIDKGQLKNIPFRDLREMYQKALGKRVGDMAYNDEIVHQSLVERGKIEIGKLIKEKFEGVKDNSEILFRSAESIKRTVNDIPEFGTRDFAKPKNEKEQAEFEASGYKVVSLGVEDGKVVPIMAKDRYTAQQGEELFNKLSPEGQRLIKDFTAAKDEAKDFFNRELIKDAYKIEGNIEGWVHHYFEEKGLTGVGKGKRIKERKAGASMKREGATGFVEDLQTAMHKMLVESETVKVYNDFIETWFARVSKPMIGETPDPGWVEVQGNVRKGVGTAQEKKTVIIKDGKAFVPKQTRYQIPTEIYKRYQLFKGLVTEASTAQQFINDLNRYWRVNILFHPGSTATNFISGGIQYTDKILTDFYTELLTGNHKFEQSKRNVSSMLNAMMPKGWANSPDWVYGGDMSNFYGQFIEKPGIVGQKIDKYADTVLKLYGGVERYWKKVISLSENVRDLNKLGKMTREGLSTPTTEERRILEDINEAVDLYAYNYNNIPTWLQEYNRGTVGKAIKPFATYPYKYMKQITTDVGMVFDRTLPWQFRVAKLLSLTTMVGFLSYMMSQQKKKQETPQATEETPAQVSPRGRLYIGTDKDGNELFVRVAKYPFFNITSSGMAFVDGRWRDGVDAMSDTIGSLGPIGNVGLLALGYQNRYQQYEKVPVIIGNSLATFTPGYRILDDVSRMNDPFQRKQDTFAQTFTKLIPTTDEDLQNKLHGRIRTIRVPTGKDKTKERALLNYKNDILLSFLTGIYLRRINPKEAEAFHQREEQNAGKREKKDTKDEKRLKNIEEKTRKEIFIK